MTEEWKNIRGFPGYQVSNLGRVRMHNKIVPTKGRGIRHYKDKILTLRKDEKMNRWKVWIRLDGKRHSLLVARLVADAFCGEFRDTEMTVNHIDGNRLNNHSDNLEWISREDNLREGFRNGLYNAVMKRCVLIDESGKHYYFESMSEANRYLQRCAGYISSMLRRGYNKISDADGRKYTAVVYDYSPSSSPNTQLRYSRKRKEQDSNEWQNHSY